MFAPQDTGTTRKVFQKPNILRRKPIGGNHKAKRGTQKCCESLDDKPLVPTQIAENKPVGATKLYIARVAEYPLPADEANIVVPTTSESCEARDVPQFTNFRSAFKEKAHSVVCTTAQKLPTTNEYCEPSEVVQDNIIQRPAEETSLLKTDFGISKSTLFGQQVDYNDEEQSSLNIDSFLVESPTKKNAVLSNDLSSVPDNKLETDVENKWCLNFMSDDSKDMVTPSFYEGSQIKISEKNDISTSFNSYNNENDSLQQTSNISKQDIIQSCLNSRVVKFKCDVPNCNKSFWNETRLQKHKTIHNKQKTSNAPAIVECPVKYKIDGEEQSCGMLFPSRDVLVQHLNEDHVPEDAPHKCSRCGRHFWWSTGMRTHAQSACTRALACTWPGCGRIFRQPCRLREHARAHTGDRPYPCNYPNCGWAFRSASKLVRHARRHTGERRHECAACGRAFLRREHLRDHAARYHAPRPTPDKPCTHAGCEQTFSTKRSLYMHLKKAHRVESDNPTKPPTTKKPATPKKPPAPKTAVSPKKVLAPKKQVAPKKTAAPKKAAAPKKPRTAKPKKGCDIEATNMLVMTLDGGSLIQYDIDVPTYTSMADAIEAANATAMIIPEEESVEETFPGVHVEGVISEECEQRVEGREEGVFVYDLEGRCARTYCTWPLQRTPREEEPYSIEDDTQVEQSEGSESNIYTVRSDLFLHGNVLINEDSEFIIRESSNRAASEAEETSNTGQLDGLDLIDSHPTIDLMQEELMYADAAVDESSFRVFMLNGEELS